jgi:hypothetical protein
MDHQRRSTSAHSVPRRTAEVLRATHSQRSRQHGGRSRYQADRRARPLRRRPERMARPARVRIRRRKPWVRLRRRLLGWNVRLVTGKLPHLRSAQQIRYGAHTARIAGGASRWQRPLRSDLLTVRGTAKPVKLDGVGPLKSGSIGDLAPTRTGGIDQMPAERASRHRTWQISQTRLHGDSEVASVALRFTGFTQLSQPGTFSRQPRCRGTVVGKTGRCRICAHSVDICVEVSEVAVPDVPARRGESIDNSRSLLRVSGSRSGARRLRSQQ